MQSSHAANIAENSIALRFTCSSLSASVRSAFFASHEYRSGARACDTHEASFDLLCAPRVSAGQLPRRQPARGRRAAHHLCGRHAGGALHTPNLKQPKPFAAGPSVLPSTLRRATRCASPLRAARRRCAQHPKPNPLLLAPVLSHAPWCPDACKGTELLSCVCQAPMAA